MLFSKRTTAAFGALTFGLLVSTAASAADQTLDASVSDTLAMCQRISTSCAAETKSAAGVLVFPNVVKADLIIGGAGGKGALVQNGKITGYYNIGAASAGLQAGIDNSSQVYVFRDAASLTQLQSGQEWKAGTSANVTAITADANARTTTGNVLAYVFDSKGLHAGVSADVFTVWKADSARPTSSTGTSNSSM